MLSSFTSVIDRRDNLPDLSSTRTHLLLQKNLLTRMLVVLLALLCINAVQLSAQGAPCLTATASPDNQAICNATAITTIAFSSSLPGTSFDWTRDNTGTVTGIAASGNGDISGTLTNTTNADVLVTFTVTQYLLHLPLRLIRLVISSSAINRLPLL